MKTFLIGLIACAALFGCSQNAKKDGSPISSGASAAQDSAAGASASKQNLRIAEAGELLPEVEKAYKGVVLSVANTKAGTNTEVEVPFGMDFKVEGTPLSVTVQSFFPDFTMVNNQVANKSMNESNPGSKVIIKKDGEVVFDSWLFQKFPDVHGFDDPDFKVIMVKPVAK